MLPIILTNHTNKVKKSLMEAQADANITVYFQELSDPLRIETSPRTSIRMSTGIEVMRERL